MSGAWGGRRRWDDVEPEHIAQLPIAQGPWCYDLWMIRDAAGDNRRGARGVCASPSCERDVYWLGGPQKEPYPPNGVGMCYAHYFRWIRAKRPVPVRNWLIHEAGPSIRTPRGRSDPGPINFSDLPTGVAHEIRFVVGHKITRGDWTPNRALRKFLKTLITATEFGVEESLLEYSPDQWLLRTRQWWPSQTSFDKVCAPYVRSFFHVLEGATDPDPWADDRWVWKDHFEFALAGGESAETRTALDWSEVNPWWLRKALKDLAKQQLVTSTVAWNTVHTWIRAARLFSSYLAELAGSKLDALHRPTPDVIDRPLFLEYLAWIRSSRQGTATELSSVNTMAYLLETLRDTGFVPGLGSAIFLRRGENPRTTIRNPRPFPPDIIELVDEFIVDNDEVDITVRTMVATTRWAGCRISELVTLPLECLQHSDGGHWIEYWMTKTQAWRRFPIPDSLAVLLLQQQQRVRDSFGEKAVHLFPAKRSNHAAGITKPWSTSGFRHHLASLFEEYGITKSSVTGEKISGGDVHRFRHTVGMTLLNNGWTQQEVRDFLGHTSDTMTSAYAKITNDTLARKAREFWAKQEATATAANPQVERLRAKFTAALPNGFCRLPATQRCDFRPNPCQDCSFHDPGGRIFLGAHLVHRDQLRTLIADATAAGDSDVVALNQPMFEKIDKIIGEIQLGTTGNARV